MATNAFAATPPSTAFADNPELQPETAVAAWLASKLAAELERVRSQGRRAIGLPLRNCGLVVETAPSSAPAPRGGAKREGRTPVTIHRVEAATAYDFARVKHLLFSEPEPCPSKPGYALRFVVLVVDENGASPVLIAPYLYEERPGLEFAHWRLVNKALVETDIFLDLDE